MDGYGWKWLEFVENGLKCLEASGSGCNFVKMWGTSWNLLETAGNCLIMLKIAGKGCQSLQMA